MTGPFDEPALLAAARQAAAHAYAPYSRFRVGAALLAEDGALLTGCNVENASYGLTLCAERNALFHAVATGRRRFRALAIAAADHPLPCGACRQALAEFCGADLPILLATLDPAAPVRRLTLGALLPHPFTLRPQP